MKIKAVELLSAAILKPLMFVSLTCVVFIFAFCICFAQVKYTPVNNNPKSYLREDDPAEADEEIFAVSGSTISIIVTDFPAKNTVDVDATAITDILRVELAELDNVKVIGRKDMESALKRNGFKALECPDLKTAVKMAKKLKVSKVVMGYVTESNNSFVIYAEVVNAGSKTPEFSIKVKVWNADQFETSCRNLASAIKKHIDKEVKDYSK
jgi:TolB-like protein